MMREETPVAFCETKRDISGRSLTECRRTRHPVGLMIRQLRQEGVVDLPFPLPYRATILQADSHVASLLQDGYGVDLTPKIMSGLAEDRALRR